MAYPLSSDVTAGQPTAHQHYNNLRADALYLGQDPANVIPLGDFLTRHIRDVRLTYLATDRLRIPCSTTNPPTIMIGGYMLRATANVDLAAGTFSGGAATWYIFAKRTAGATTFTLEANTSPVETSTTRIIGQVQWDGSHLILNSIRTYDQQPLPYADYDSGWFACAYNNTYTKAHSLGVTPRLVILWHSAIAAPGPGDEIADACVAYSNVYAYAIALKGANASNVYVTCPNQAGYGTITSARYISGGGYYRILAWI